MVLHYHFVGDGPLRYFARTSLRKLEIFFKFSNLNITVIQVFCSGCTEVGACFVGPEELRPQYAKTVFGFVSAFMTAYVQVQFRILWPIFAIKQVCFLYYCLVLGEHGAAVLHDGWKSDSIPDSAAWDRHWMLTIWFNNFTKTLRIY